MKQADLLMTIAVTPNEVIALNVAMHYYLAYFQRISPEYREASGLLRQFQDRLVEQVSGSAAVKALPGVGGR